MALTKLYMEEREEEKKKGGRGRVKGGSVGVRSMSRRVGGGSVGWVGEDDRGRETS
ncbi:hypothetical protein ACE6H2_009005 [Prunus campanulata]